MREIQGVPGHPDGGGVDHLAVHIYGPGAPGLGLLVGGDDLFRPLDFVPSGIEELVVGLDLSCVVTLLAV